MVVIVAEDSRAWVGCFSCEIRASKEMRPDDQGKPEGGAGGKGIPGGWNGRCKGPVAGLSLGV